ncbi:MAG: VWA domain-containing protein, partial [Gemmataceae bacterium]|nr:VWA domain-containing protein [Gemmataceae bacterium]
NYTDLAAALKLALASFPEGAARRIVLITDGNENLGDAEEQARLAAALGVEIDVLPLASGVKATNEVMVEAVVAPPVADQGARVPIRVMVRSRVPEPATVVGRLTVRQVSDAKEAVKIVARLEDARVRFGLNRFEFEQPVDEKQRSYTYEAEFEPLATDDGKGKRTRGLPGDRVQNNRASTHVVARGTGRILLLESRAGDHAELVEKLAGDKRFKVVAEPVEILENYKERDKLAVFLSNFDCVVLANVPADRVSPEHMEVLRSNTHDQGCGLVMIGGAEGFGAGGWQNTPVEKALPVDCEIKSLKVQGKGGLVLVMHASEMADGNRWQKIIAKLAVERLGPNDEVGIIDYDFNCKWHVKMQPAGPNRRAILNAIDTMVPGDMPDFDPALKMAHDALMDKKKDFGARHIIIISDGDPQQNDKVLLRQIKADKISIATVGVATHGAPQDAAMSEIATDLPGGKKRYYKVDDPKKLPAIYIKETRLVSQSFVVRNPFQPVVAFRTEPIRRLADLPRLGGFVRTTRKPDPLVEVPILTPKIADQEFPVLAHWQYGLGKAVAFTSDAGRPDAWCRPWVDDGVFAPFWGQVLAWSLRPTESSRLRMTTERLPTGKVRIIVEAKNAAGEEDTDLKIVGGITPPSGKGGEPGKKEELRFVQKNSGQYEAEAKADEAGSYFIAAQAIRKVKKRGPDGKEAEVEERESVRAGITLPYSPEFTSLGTDDALLEKLRDLTGGRRYFDDAGLLAEAATSGAVFREPRTRARSSLPFHYWLLFMAAGLLLADVAVRRLAFSADEAREALGRMWSRLRG